MLLLPDLKYPYEALEPSISRETMRLHHDKHHGRYVAVANELLAKSGAPDLTPESMLSESEGLDAKLLNNLGQAWNHAFLWETLTPDYRAPTDGLLEVILQAFGSFENLRERVLAAGTSHFGSGWVWLVARGADLEVITTHDGVSVAGARGLTPLLVCDLWEHAYYLDYQNDRATFLASWWDNLTNWSFAEGQYVAANNSRATAWSYPR